MPINFDISQVITALTNLKNAIEKPGPLLDGLGDLMVEKLQQTTPEEEGTLRQAMSKRGKPYRRGRKWTIGIGDPDALGTPGTMQPGTGSDKGLIAAFLKVYRDQRKAERAERDQAKQTRITTKINARSGRQAEKWQNQIIKDQDRFQARKRRKTRIGGEFVGPNITVRKAKANWQEGKLGRQKANERRKRLEFQANKLSRPLTRLESRIRVTTQNIGVRNELIAAREKYKALVSRGLEEGWTDKKFIGEFRSHYKYIKTLTARTSGKIKGGVALEALDVEQVGFYTPKIKTPKVKKTKPPLTTNPKIEWSNLKERTNSKIEAIKRWATVGQRERRFLKKQSEQREQFNTNIKKIAEEIRQLREQWISAKRMSRTEGLADWYKEFGLQRPKD